MIYNAIIPTKLHVLMYRIILYALNGNPMHIIHNTTYRSMYCEYTVWLHSTIYYIDWHV